MSSVTFRHPGLLAIQVGQVDRMSGGRIELGPGAGWYAEEHPAYGIPFPSGGSTCWRSSRDLGAQRIYLQLFDLGDEEHTELLASEVVAPFR